MPDASRQDDGLINEPSAAALAAACLEAQGYVAARRPTLDIDPRLRTLWPRLLAEEVAEFRDAVAGQNLRDVADALGDILYVAYQAAASYGIPIDAVFREVHRSNLTKVGPDGAVAYRDDGKVLKPPSYSPPDIAGVLKRHLQA